MSTIYLLLAILTLIFTFITQKKYSYNLKKVIPILLLGMAISLIILIFPNCFHQVKYLLHLNLYRVQWRKK